MFDIVVLIVVLDPPLAEEDEQRVRRGEDGERRRGCNVIVLEVFFPLQLFCLKIHVLLAVLKQRVRGGWREEDGLQGNCVRGSTGG